MESIAYKGGHSRPKMSKAEAARHDQEANGMMPIFDQSYAQAQKDLHENMLAQEATLERDKLDAAFEAPRAALWTHVPGSKVYEGLFPQYVLPSGSGAFMYR